MTVTTTEFELTEEEFRQLLAPSLRQTNRRIVWLAIIFILCGFAGLAAGWWGDGFWPWFGVYFLIYGIILIPVHQRGQRKRVRRIFNETLSAKLPRVLRFDEAGVSATHPLGASNLRWPAYSHFIEADTLFILFEGPAAPSAVPKRALATPDDETTLRTMFQRFIGRSTFQPIKGFEIVASEPM